MKKGILIYDSSTNRFDVLYEEGNSYGGLHCGTTMEVLINDEWVPPSHRVRKRLVSRRSAEGIVTRTSSKNIATTYQKGSLSIKGAALFLYPIAERRNPSCRNACSDTNGLSCTGLICRSVRESWVIGRSWPRGRHFARVGQNTADTQTM